MMDCKRIAIAMDDNPATFYAVRMAKHWITEEIGKQLAASGPRISIELARGDSAPNYASTKTRVYGPGGVEYTYHGGSITTAPTGKARVL